MGEREIFGDFRIRDADSVASAIATFLHARIDRSKPGRLLIVK
jgi:transmembrane sensor